MAAKPLFALSLMASLCLGACANTPGTGPVAADSGTPEVAEASADAGLPAGSPVTSSTFDLAPGQKTIGSIGAYVTRKDDTLLDIARRYDLGYTQLVAANRGIDPWRPGIGRKLILPSYYVLPDVPHKGIVINLVQQRLYYFPPGGRSVITFPIGVGIEGWPTPLGVTHVTAKQTHPIWVVPASIRAERPELPASIPPGPDNPLGNYAFTLGWPSYLIHGTNKPFGIGRNVSHGCIQLYPEDIGELFSMVPVGTPVRVLKQDVVATWVGDDLYVAVFPNKRQTEDLDISGHFEPAPSADLKAVVKAAIGKQTARLDGKALDLAERTRTGIPLRVTLPAGAKVKVKSPDTPTDMVAHQGPRKLAAE